MNIFSKKPSKLLNRASSFFTTYSTAINNNGESLNHYNKNEKKLNELSSNAVVIERNGGLRNRFVLSLIGMWYFFSATTLYTSKYIVATQHANPKVIATTQMFMTSLLGYLQMTLAHKRSQTKSEFIINSETSTSTSLNRSAWMLCLRNMIVIGLLRFVLFISCLCFGFCFKKDKF